MKGTLASRTQIVQLIHLTHNIHNALDNQQDVCLIFLDVSNAFD